MAGVLPVSAQTPELWKGVVLVEGGTLAGDWKPVVPRPDSPDRWDQWELMEKMSRPEQLRRSAPPGATMVPDRQGRSVLVVAPSSGVRGMVVDVGSGMADIRGAGIKNAMLRLGDGGQVVVQDSALSGFHVVESQGEKPGGMILMTGCGISGPFGGAFISGNQRWVIRGCHFHGALLPWVSTRAPQQPLVVGCHFEKCFVPESFLLNCRDCTFDECIIGRPEAFAAGGVTAYTLTEAGIPSRLPPRTNAAVAISVSQGRPRTVFWGGWEEGDETSVVACSMHPATPVQAKLLSEGQETASELAAGAHGKSYRRTDASERLMLEGTTLQIQELGKRGNQATVTPGEGRSMEWSQMAGGDGGLDQEGNSLKNAGPLRRRALFTPDYQNMVVLEDGPAGAMAMARVFSVLPEGLALARERTTRAVGSVWSLQGTEEIWLRFDTAGQLTWIKGAAGTRGSSAWRPLTAEGELVIANWQGTAAGIKLHASLQSLQLTVGHRVWEGTRIGRESSQSFEDWVPGQLPVAAVAQGANPPSGPGPATAPAAPPPASSSAAADPPIAAAGLKSRTSRVNGLLVSVLPGGKTAGATSQMNAAALPAPSRVESSLDFNQKIGPEMTKALAEVRKFQTIRQGTWPGGYQIEVSFADKYTPKDGPSAAVACALLLEGLFTGQAWDPAFAVTGDLNADGSVQPVGGVPAKIRGAIGRQCRIVAVPAANERAVRDYLLAEGPHALMGIHIFALKEFDQARDLALTTRPAGLAQALADFDKVVDARITKDRAASWAKLPAVASQLRKVVSAAPHHLSARLLLEYAEGRGPATLSLAGSIETIDRESGDVIAAIREASANRNLGGLKKDSLGDTVFRLRRLRPIMHPETRRLLDSIESFSTLVRNFMTNPPRTAPVAQKAYDSITVAGALVQSENQKLRTNPEVVAELMKE